MLLSIRDLEKLLGTDQTAITKAVGAGSVPTPAFIRHVGVRWSERAIREWVDSGCPREEAPAPRDTLDLVREIGEETIRKLHREEEV
jgi:predicted DNA-binding transcriptional regulator AlpA